MPAYVSHTIMAKDVYNKIDNSNVDLNYMITYSLGGDLCKYSKCRKDSHRIKQEEFINNLYNYMKDNNLLDDKECLGVLYGHICHLIMDNTIHPLIRKIDKECTNNKKNHTMIEMYYDYYLVKNKYNTRLNKYDNKSLFLGKMNKKISNMIDYAYLKTYNCNKVSKYYKFNLFLYKKIKLLYKLFSFNMIKRIVHINEFLKNNKDIDLVNHNNKISYKINDKEYNYDFDTLYEMSVKEASNLINNKYCTK